MLLLIVALLTMALLTMALLTMALLTMALLTMATHYSACSTVSETQLPSSTGSAASWLPG